MCVRLMLQRKNRKEGQKTKKKANALKPGSSKKTATLSQNRENKTKKRKQR